MDDNKKIAAIATDETLPDLPRADVEKAKKEGALDAVREGAKTRFRQTDGIAVNDPEPRIVPTYDVAHLQSFLELEPGALKDWLEGKADGAFVPALGQVAGLLEVERSGKNRTDTVEVLCKHLKIDTPYEVTDAGPPWTEDVSRKVVKPRG